MMQFRLLLISLAVFGLAAPASNAGDCGNSPGLARDISEEATFTVGLPVVPRYESLLDSASIEIPNGRPIYALIVHGYTQNKNFNQLLLYNFAKRLMEDGAYVHWAWWNNLCAEYMEGPLHHPGSYPGQSGLMGVIDGAVNADNKALPADDYQFQADAEAFLQAIRKHNPRAIIIVVGHSMGGAAVARLGTNTKVAIDILAPIDPVDNRSRPWVIYGSSPYHNWTRYRIGHEDLESWPPPNPEKPRTFPNNIINLFHRYQMEYEFPMDHQYRVHFKHNIPPGGTSTQRSVTTCGTEIITCSGVCCYMDGHGEIVGYRGMLNPFEANPRGIQMRGGWPTGRDAVSACERRRLLIELPQADFRNDWKYRPENPDFCLVSEGLISLYESMNRPPVADAGGDRIVEYRASGVLLDGSASYDPDGDTLLCDWKGDGWKEIGTTVRVDLGVGAHVCSLTVADSSGHYDIDVIEVAVVASLDSELQTSTPTLGAHPNPFNIGTQVFFELTERERVSLEIFDLKGRLVRSLEEGTFDTGRHESFWNARNNVGRVVSSGPYFVRMRAGDRTEVSKILLLK